MHTSSVVAVVALLSASLTSATFCGSRDNDIPQCAKGCFYSNNPPTNLCGNDPACYCRNSWMNSLECCAQGACNDRDTSTFNTIVTQVCSSYGAKVALTCPATSRTLATSTPKTSTTAAGVSTTPASIAPPSPNAQLTSAASSPASSTAASATTSSANVCTCGGGGGGSGGSSSAPAPASSNTQAGPASLATQIGGSGGSSSNSNIGSGSVTQSGGSGGGSTPTGLASSITQTTVSPTSAPAPINPTTLSTILSSATATLPTKPTTVPSVGAYTYQGCYTEATNGNRALNETRYIDPANMTVEKCVGFCQATGMTWAGLEYSQECWCGDQMQFTNGAVKLASALESACGMPCSGDPTELCGGWAVLGVYQAT